VKHIIIGLLLILERF